MRFGSRVLGIAMLSFAAAACGDSAGGDGGSGGDGGAGGTQTSTVSGTVSTANDVPFEGATVAVVGTSISATTNERGEFTLEGVQNGEVFFSTEAEGHWGVVDYYDVPDETLGGIELGLLPDREIAMIEDALERTIDPELGVVDITFAEAAGGESGSIDASSDAPFTFDSGDPVVRDTVIAEDGSADLVFTSVDPDDGPVDAMVTGAPGVTDCAIDESQGTRYPIVAKSVTIVYAGCGPAQ